LVGLGKLYVFDKFKVIICFVTFRETLYIKQDAVEFVMDDLQFKYPNAEYEVLDVQNVTSGNNDYYSIKVSVTEEATSECPLRIHLYYDYPDQNFVTDPPDYITRDCKTCAGKPGCVLLFKEEAIIASHMVLGTEDVNQYINLNYNVTHETEYVTNYNDLFDVWQVTWKSDSASDYYTVVLKSDGTLHSIERFEA